MSGPASRSSTVVDLLWTLLRYLYAAWFLFFAGFMLVAFHGHVPGSVGPGADPFLAALNAIGFVEPMLIAVYLVAGAALLFRRTVPLGLVLVAGPVAMIAAFHFFHTGMILWGGIWPLGWIALAWRFRRGFSSLWNFPLLNLGAVSRPLAIKDPTPS